MKVLNAKEQTEERKRHVMRAGNIWKGIDEEPTKETEKR